MRAAWRDHLTGLIGELLTEGTIRGVRCRMRASRVAASWPDAELYEGDNGTGEWSYEDETGYGRALVDLVEDRVLHATYTPEVRAYFGVENLLRSALSLSRGQLILPFMGADVFGAPVLHVPPDRFFRVDHEGHLVDFGSGTYSGSLARWYEEVYARVRELTNGEALFTPGRGLGAV